MFFPEWMLSETLVRDEGEAVQATLSLFFLVPDPINIPLTRSYTKDIHQIQVFCSGEFSIVFLVVELPVAGMDLFEESGEAGCSSLCHTYVPSRSKLTV